MLDQRMLSHFSFRSNIWMIGVPLYLAGVIDRSINAFCNNYVSYSDFFFFLITICLSLGWLYLKPDLKDEHSFSKQAEFYVEQQNIERQNNVDNAHLLAVQARMLKLQEHHVVSQLHVLPFPYICQIYHLLNLKHLETVHSISLGNLKVIEVSSFQPTPVGGTLRFKTVLESSINILKMWRRPTVEVELTLHTPYTVELSIPVYGNKRMIVLFNVFPLEQDSHELLINIYTDLNWSKPLLRVFLHLASLITLYEDTPYLEKLAKRSFDGLLYYVREADYDTVCLFKRFISLYALKLEQDQAAIGCDSFAEA